MASNRPTARRSNPFALYAFRRKPIEKATLRKFAEWPLVEAAGNKVEVTCLHYSETAGKWTVTSFASSAGSGGFPRGTAEFAEARPFNDVNLIAAVLNDDAEAARKALEEKNGPVDFRTLLVPGGMQNPIVQKLGILAEDEKRNIVILRPDGSIATALSGLTMSYQEGNVVQTVIESHEEKRVDDALARGDLEEAKRLAFAYAPVEQLPPPDAKKNGKPKPIAVPHLRSRGKVYMAMGDSEAALADAQAVYLQVKGKAGYLSMRTAELDEAEELKEAIRNARGQPASEK